MAYQVLARKWRPQQFDDVVGQEHVTQTLKNAVQTGRLAHAYLFVGSRGIGKTSIARIFAKALNCERGGPTVTPCGECDSCREITGGNSFDVLEIDGASNNGVEQVRELRDTVKFAPVRGTFKIYIIDEVHMLSTAAFNALLKTLEEPPPHVKFFFATTEPDKILPTIVSRCQRFDLRRIPVPLIVERLEMITQSDGITADRDALLAVARGAEGGMRDAQSALDQLIAFRGSEIHEEDVLTVFGLMARQTLEQMAAHILAGETAPLLETVAGLDASGKDLQRVVAELMTHFRNLLVCLNVPQPDAVLDATPEQIAVLKAQAAQSDTERVLRITDILSALEDRMRYALSRRTLLETGLIRCARAAATASIDEILKALKALQASGGEGAAPERVEARTRPAGFVEKQAAEAPPPPAPEAELERLQQEWKTVVGHATRLVRSLHGPLLDARPVLIEGDTLTVGMDPEFASEAEQFQSPNAARALKVAVERVLGRTLNVKVRPIEATGTRPVTPRLPSPPAAEPEPAAPPAPATGGRSRFEWMQDKDVQQVLEMFNGNIVELRQ